MRENTDRIKVTDKKAIVISSDEKVEKKRKETYAYTYIVECGDGSLYTGWTNHLEERMMSHNQGKGAKYTRARLPVRLVHYEMFATKQEAMRREYAIKQLSRKDKLILIEKQSLEVRNLCDDIATRIKQHMVEL